VRNALLLDRARFVDFALLLGTDFAPRLRGVGPLRALRLIREHGSIERVVVEVERRFPPRGGVPRSYLVQVVAARGVFETLPPLPDVALLQPGLTDDAGIVEILQRCGLHQAASAAGYSCHTALDGNYFQDDPSAY
jgi:flap endonuclease-1